MNFLVLPALVLINHKKKMDNLGYKDFQNIRRAAEISKLEVFSKKYKVEPSIR